MTKTELMENYTAEQLAEMVIAGEQIGEILMDVITGGNNKIPIEECKIVKIIRRDENGIWLNVEDADFIQNYSKMQKTISNNQSEVAKLNSEVEKYRKAFEDAKKERDCQISEYQKKIEELTNEKESLETRLKLLKNERDDLREEVERLRNAQDFSNLEPIGVANIIINSKGTRENLFGRITGKGTTETYRIFDVPELRQIAEHLLVYCNHNEEA